MLLTEPGSARGVTVNPDGKPFFNVRIFNHAKIMVHPFLKLNQDVVI